MLKKLQTKFICVNMLIVVVMLCVIFGLVFHFTAKSLESESLQALQTIADSQKRPTPPIDDSTDVRLPYFEVMITRQGILVDNGSGFFDLSDTDTLAAIAEEAFATGQQSGKLEKYQLRFLLSSGPAGERLIFVDASGEDATMNNLIQNSILISIVSLVLFFGLSILFARWAVKPVAQAWDQQKQFVADASHELKTPLTVIMTSAELLQDPSQTEDSLQQSSSRILIMAKQMRELVEALLDLARADNGTAKMEFSPESLSQIIENAVLTFEPLFFEKELELRHSIQEEITLPCSPSHIYQVAEILLDNAMKYSTPGGTIRVCLTAHGSHALLSVASPGSTIAPADLKNIFKRFYRLDEARTRDGSYGLGLSIAESIVTAHRGRIWAESRDGINTFHVQLPL